MPLIESLASQARDHGYACTVVLVEGRDCGVPQRRNRMFCLFHNVRMQWERPRHRHLTVGDAIGPARPPVRFDPERDVAKLQNSIREILPHVPPGKSCRDVFNQLNGLREGVKYDKAVVKGRPSFQSRRLSWDKPAFTMTGGAKLIHPDEPRLLSVQEAALLSGYPEGYEFVGNLSDRYAQIAKAVLPPTAAWLAENVRRSIDVGEELQHDEFDVKVIDFTKGGK